MSVEDLRERYGRRVQRCSGCFIAYHLKDMYLAADASYFCQHCRDETMFHFNEFSAMLDLGSLPSMSEDQ